MGADPARSPRVDLRIASLAAIASTVARQAHGACELRHGPARARRVAQSARRSRGVRPRRWCKAVSAPRATGGPIPRDQSCVRSSSASIPAIRSTRGTRPCWAARTPNSTWPAQGADRRARARSPTRAEARAWPRSRTEACAAPGRRRPARARRPRGRPPRGCAPPPARARLRARRGAGRARRTRGGRPGRAADALTRPCGGPACAPARARRPRPRGRRW